MNRDRSRWEELKKLHKLISLALLGCLLAFLTACTPKVTATSQPGTPQALAATLAQIGASTNTPTVQAVAAQATSTATPGTGITLTSQPEGGSLPGVLLPETPALIFLQMIDPDTGWGLSEQAVMHTNDGGKTWRDVSPDWARAEYSVPWGSFLDGETGWVTLPDPQTYGQGTLFSTQDGGATWEEAAAPFGGAQLQFLDEQHGWAFESSDCGAGSCNANVFQTADGGQIWEKVYAIDPENPDRTGGLPFSGNKTGMTMLGNGTGWVGGTVPMDAYIWLFKTSDNARSWSHAELTLPAGYENSMTSTEPPVFLDEKTGVLPVSLYLGEFPARVFYWTKDGGETWQASSVVNNFGQYSITRQGQVFVWDGLTMHTSQDGGKTWEKFTPNIDLSTTLNQFQMVDALNGFASSLDADGKGMLYRTSDGGKTWTEP